MPNVRPRSSKKVRKSTVAARRLRTRARSGDDASHHRAELSAQLLAIQLNTAGLCGRHWGDEVSTAKLHSTHAAVRRIRLVLQRTVMVPRQGPVWRALVDAALAAASGNKSLAAELLGISRRQFDRVVQEPVQ